jgi:hypothetical protein
MLIYFGIFIVIFVMAMFLIRKPDLFKNNKKLSFFFVSLGVNIGVLPISFFIGGMATDADNYSKSASLHFLQGFLVVQAIPLILLVISLLIIGFGIIKIIIRKTNK